MLCAAIFTHLPNFPQSLVYSKALTRDMENKTLHEVNDRECDRLVERWTSDDCMNAIMKFFSGKSKV